MSSKLSDNKKDGLFPDSKVSLQPKMRTGIYSKTKKISLERFILAKILLKNFRKNYFYKIFESTVDGIKGDEKENCPPEAYKHCETPLGQSLRLEKFNQGRLFLLDHRNKDIKNSYFVNNSRYYHDMAGNKTGSSFLGCRFQF